MTTVMPESVPLSTLRKGESGCIDSCMEHECLELVRALGLDVAARVSVCRRGDPFIVRVEQPCGGSCRIGIRREIGERILVRLAGVQPRSAATA